MFWFIRAGGLEGGRASVNRTADPPCDYNGRPLTIRPERPFAAFVRTPNAICSTAMVRRLMLPKWIGMVLLLPPWGWSTVPAPAAEQPQNELSILANQTVTLSFAGPQTSETATSNPFTDYRLDVVFDRFADAEGPAEKRVIRGFYAADGRSADTSAVRGNIWQCRFTPPRSGRWKYQARLRRGPWVAIGENLDTAESIELTNPRGKVDGLGVSVPDHSSEPFDRTVAIDRRDFRNHGRLTVDNGYYRLPNQQGSWIKAGTNSPENLLAYVDFDATDRLFAKQRAGEAKTSTTVHHYAPHAEDWRPNDPTWGDGRGKNLIGGLNYLSSVGINSIYFLTWNVGGDGNDVWPHLDPDTLDRFDCSKLDQWEIVFEHANRRGIHLHVILQETENERALDGGDTGRMRKLYYQELIARFAHHLAITWNIGEESGPADFSPDGQTTEQQKSMCDALANMDPYDNPILVHSHAASQPQDDVLLPLIGHRALAGVSLQVGRSGDVHQRVQHWRNRSDRSGHRWVVSMDEIGPAAVGAVPDAVDPTHDSIRGSVLYGSLLAGAAGVEWYFGYQHDQSDLTAEDWRSRDELWRQTVAATKLIGSLPVRRMESADDLVQGGPAYCLAATDRTIGPWCVYLPAVSALAEPTLSAEPTLPAQSTLPVRSAPTQIGVATSTYRLKTGGGSADRTIVWHDAATGHIIRRSTKIESDIAGKITLQRPTLTDCVAIVRQQK